MPRPRRLSLLSLAAVAAGMTVAVWLLWPAERVTQENAAKIRAGMHLSEVQGILGEPAGGATTIQLIPWPASASHMELWHSRRSGTRIEVFFNAQDRVVDSASEHFRP